MKIVYQPSFYNDNIYLDIFNLSFKFVFYPVSRWRWLWHFRSISLRFFYWQFPTMSIIWVIRIKATHNLQQLTKDD